jgi:hypothetical protein
LVNYFWSGKHGRAVKGVCLVTLLYTDPNGVCLPVNFRLARLLHHVMVSLKIEPEVG